MAVDICYIVSHGFAARMLLQTNLIGRLTGQGASVALVTPDPNDQNLAVFKDNEKVKIVPWDGKASIWDDNYLHKRMYYLEDINANTALKEKFYNGLFFSKSKHPWKRVRPLWYFLIYHLIRFIPSIRKRFLVKEGKYLQSDEAQKILDSLEPRMLVSTYPVSIIEAKMLFAAKRMGIPTVLQLLSWDNISTKGKFPVLPDRFIVWGDIMRQELNEYYHVPDSDITVCGVAHFDQHVEVKGTTDYQQVLEALGLSGRKPYLLVAMSSPRFAPREIDIVEWLAGQITENSFGKDMQIVVRPHPQNVQTFMAKASWLDRLKALASDRVAVDFPSLNEGSLRWSMKKQDMVRLSKLLSGAAICINSGSTISIEALIHGKPVILTSFDGTASLPYWNSARRLIDYNHLKKLVDMKGVTTTGSYESLSKTILRFLENPSLDLALREKTRMAQCYENDGKATHRVIETLISNLKAH